MMGNKPVTHQDERQAQGNADKDWQQVGLAQVGTKADVQLAADMSRHKQNHAASHGNGGPKGVSNDPVWADEDDTQNNVCDALDEGDNRPGTVFANSQQETAGSALSPEQGAAGNHDYQYGIA